MKKILTIWLLGGVWAFGLSPAMGMSPFSGMNYDALTPEQKILLSQAMDPNQLNTQSKNPSQAPASFQMVSGNVVAVASENATKDASSGSLLEVQYNAVDVHHSVDIQPNTMSNVLFRPWLRQFGYNFFNTTSYYDISNDATVPSSYQLQKGDRFTLFIYGKKEQVLEFLIDAQGEVFVPNIGPVVVSGLSVTEAQTKLSARLRKKYVNFDAKIKLNTVKNVVILISGNVVQPGTYSVNKFESIFSVLSKAQGIAKTGSLRRITVLSSNGRKRYIDLYDYLLNDRPDQVTGFREGDVLFVPGIGDTVAITGEVTSPGIYEIQPNDTLKDVFRYASGPGLNAYLKTIYINRFDASFKRSVTTVPGPDNGANVSALGRVPVQRGDVIFINQKSTDTEGYVTVVGHVNVPERVAYTNGLTLGDVIDAAEGVRPGAHNTVHVFRYVSDDRRALVDAQLTDRAFALVDRDVVTIYNETDLSAPELIHISGEVISSGDYTYFENMRLSDALILAKPNPMASLYAIEVARFNGKRSEVFYVSRANAPNFTLMPGDKISVKKDGLKDQTVSIELSGEFVFPGTYIVNKGTPLSAVIERAGGYTDSAYLKGAVFTRTSVSQYDEMGQEKVIKDEKRRLIYDQSHLGSMSVDTQVSFGVMMTARQEALKFLESKSGATSGRVIIDLHKDDFQTSRDNFMVQDGDVLRIPTRPESVHLIGGVQQGISIAYNKKYTLNDYVQNVGGYTKYADKRNVYVFKSSGRVFQNARHIEPGDIIYVPERVSISFNWLQFLTNITQIVSNAVTSIALVKSLQ
ncbi:MAG: SLBB domain-containing protein [Candidatus Marinamargulisbacteria bacterium]